MKSAKTPPTSIDPGPPSLTLPDPPPPVPEPVERCIPCTEFQYAVKLVQGPSPALTEQSFIAPGRYFTIPNIHNPSTCKTVRFRWKVAIDDLDGRHVSTITPFQEVTLRPDEAVEIDARDIAKWSGISITRFVKGFVVIESPCELDVVAVYTAFQTGAAGLAFHTERVPARQIEACRDLKLDISTGVADWRLTSSPMTSVITPCQATVLPTAENLTNPPWGVQPGSKWISARGGVNFPPPFPAGWYVFQLCFTLCSGFSHPTLDIKAMVDDKAWIRLNGGWVPTPYLPGSPHIPWSLLGPPVTVPTITSGFLPGRNCLELVVHNDANTHPTNPVGVNVHGTLTAERGACAEGCGCCS